MFSKQLAMVLQARSASARAVCGLCALMWMTTAPNGCHNARALSRSASRTHMLQRRATVQHGRAERTADERTRRANDQDDCNYDAVPRRAAAEKGSTRTILAEAKRHSGIGAAGE
jgi:hypothetical protein